MRECGWKAKEKVVGLGKKEGKKEGEAEKSEKGGFRRIK
jgi:hypothetical protein